MSSIDYIDNRSLPSPFLPSDVISTDTVDNSKAGLTELDSSTRTAAATTSATTDSTISNVYIVHSVDNAIGTPDPVSMQAVELSLYSLIETSTRFQTIPYQ